MSGAATSSLTLAPHRRVTDKRESIVITTPPPSMPPLVPLGVGRKR